MNKIKTINQYISTYPKDIQQLLKAVRTTIKKVAPDAEETISYGIPTFKLQKNLVHFGAFKNHIGFFPTAAGISAFKKELSLYQVSKGTVQFPYNKPIPHALIRKIVKFRVGQEKPKEKPKLSTMI